MFIDNPGNYGSLYLTGKDPAARQNDVALRIRSQGRVVFDKLIIRDCGMPIRHESGDLYIHTLDAARFTADLLNSTGNIEIFNLIVDFDGTNFTWEDYKGIHPDALGQFFDHKTGVVRNVKIHNIYARIRGELIQGFMLSETDQYTNFHIGTGSVDIEIDYKYAFSANTLEDSYVNVGDCGVRILDKKLSDYTSGNVEIERHSSAQLINTDFPYYRPRGRNMNTTPIKKTKVALIVGHNDVSQGAVRQGQSEFKYWGDFFLEHMGVLNSSAAANGIELKVFKRKYHGSRTYGTEMREVHKRIDEWGADTSVECHYNGFHSKAEGHEVLHFNKSKGGKIIAELMDQCMDMWLDNKDRNRKPVSQGESGSTGLRVGGSRSVLIEPFFGQEIGEFKSSGTQRQNLVNVFKTFFKKLGELNSKTNNVTTIPNSYLTDAELELAIELLS